MRPDALVGKQLDEFKVIERIGRGGMATVYRAHQTSFNRDVALKVINLEDEGIAGENFRVRFEQEARVIASLEHIHILPVFSYGIENDIAFLAMRLLRGGTLSDVLDSGPLPLERTVELFTQVARGLSYAHQRGVVHRDLKPGNILLDDEGNACLTDFGLAKLMGDEADLTKSGHIVGTPVYMAPEQLRGERLDHRSDLYSLGIILYQMLTGRPPFDSPDSDLVAIIYKHLEMKPDPISELNLEVPPAVEAVVMKALAKNPDDRYQNALAMSNALREAAGVRGSSADILAVEQSHKPDLPTRAFSPPPSTSQLRRLAQSRPGMASLVAALMILLVGALALALLAGGENGPGAPIVLADTTMTLAEIIPTDDDIRHAQRRLGDGFVALVACNRSSEYHAAIAREISEFASDAGLRIQIYDSDNDPYRQITLIEQARGDGAAGMILCPLNLELLHEQLVSVDAVDLPLVMYSGGDNNYGGVIMTGDEYDLGQVTGLYAGQVIRDEMGGQARVIILDFPDLPGIVARADGIEDGARELAPEVTIIGRYLGATRANGYDSVRRLLADGVAFDMILSINDAGSFGAIQALEEAGIAPDAVTVISIDAEALAQQYIRSGHYMRASTAVARTESARSMVYSLIKLLAGGTIAESVVVPPGGMVTRESLEQQPDSDANG